MQRCSSNFMIEGQGHADDVDGSRPLLARRPENPEGVADQGWSFEVRAGKRTPRLGGTAAAHG